MNTLNITEYDFSIENNFLVYNKNIYLINIDYSEIKLGSTNFILIMENSHINLTNTEHNDKNYFFQDCVFYMNSNLINIGRLVYNLSDCNFRITRARILINNIFYKFTFSNNSIHILNFPLQINQNFINNINENNTNVKNIILSNILPNNADNTNNTSNDKNIITKLSKLSTDRQNVHDSQILDHLVDIFKTLKMRNKSEEFYELKNIILDIQNYIKSLITKIPFYSKILYKFNFQNDSNKLLYNRNTINKVLEKIQFDNGFIYRFDETEAYVLCLTWSNCTTDNLKNIFLDNLLDMAYFSNNNIFYYCLTGRVTRMLTTFEGFIVIPNKHHMLYLRSEMLNQCAIIRNQNKELETDELKKIITDALYKIYVQSDILTEEVFYNEINTWIDFI